MSSTRRARFVLAVTAALVVATAPGAAARSHHHRLAANSVTLTASATTVDFGHTVRLSGQIDPPAAGESVEIRDDADAPVTSATTGSAGRFRVVLTLAGTSTLHASWQGLDSAPVTIRVRAVVTIRIGAVRLFDVVHVTGRVRPARPGEAVTVSLLRAGRTLATRKPSMRAAGSFRTSFRAPLPGTYRARATFSSSDLLRGSARSGADTTPVPSLSQGDRGVFVKLLERRLRALRYHLTRVDRGFDFRTADAVIAFRKVQGMDRNSRVTSTLWRALATPKRLHPRGSGHGFHIEINQTKQVVFTVEEGEVTGIIPTSTGKPSTPTYDGAFRVARKLAGYSEHGLFYPSYFNGNRAIHGWPDVPTYPASHGCSRVPMWTARWIYGLAPIGTRVLVYHASR
jgi:lipoprotein-anchoring transpeptidase ErfK/SrfK